MNARRERKNNNERGPRAGRNRIYITLCTVKSEVYQVQLVCPKHFKTSSATNSALSVFSCPLRDTHLPQQHYYNILIPSATSSPIQRITVFKYRRTSSTRVLRFFFPVDFAQVQVRTVKYLP